MNIYILIIIVVLFIINDIIIILYMIKKHKSNNNIQYSPYATIMESIDLLRDSGNDNCYHLCVCDSNLVSLYDRGILNSTNLDL